ncbi:AHH domain-containing protein [Bacillus sp. B1-b2]|uniref:AHH domain-containing protein n=1 Tax=Bacillus sp. B1-b2 TaxID=2653201 RepID=UPI001D02CCA1|nr:AHH domain-containing protein [Bacillus sp. B1-b2]
MEFRKRAGVAIYEIAEGLISLVVDAGIIAVSGIIPDSVEPAFIKNASTTRIETFNETLEQIIDDPILVLESVAQSISDTAEKDGIMYVAGGAATSLIPYVGQTKYLKLLKVDKGNPIKSNGVSPSIAIKTKELVQNNKVFEGIKRETVEWYRDVKYSGTKMVQEVNQFLGRTLFPNQNLQVSMANQVPINVLSRLAVEDRIDLVVYRFDGKVTKKTGNTVSDYINDIIVNGKVDAVRVNKLKNAIQNNTFSVDELSEVRKKMSELGITKEYEEALIKMDFGKYLRGLIGEPPIDMINPHAHHILFKKGLGPKQQELVREGQEILKRYGIDPIIGEENLVWAPNAVVGQHSLDALELVVNRLKAIEEMGGDFDDIVEALEDLGDIASTR